MMWNTTNHKANVTGVLIVRQSSIDHSSVWESLKSLDLICDKIVILNFRQDISSNLVQLKHQKVRLVTPPMLYNISSQQETLYINEVIESLQTQSIFFLFAGEFIPVQHCRRLYDTYLRLRESDIVQAAYLNMIYCLNSSTRIISRELYRNEVRWIKSEHFGTWDQKKGFLNQKGKKLKAINSHSWIIQPPPLFSNRVKNFRDIKLKQELFPAFLNKLKVIPTPKKRSLLLTLEKFIGMRIFQGRPFTKID